MRTVLYPGSFDPVTVGHLDIIERAALLFDEVIVGVLHNPAKQSGLFPPAERVALLEEAVRPLGNVSVRQFDGLLVNAVAHCGAQAVLRGLRNATDAEEELQMARLNRHIAGAETVFMAAAPGVMHVSSDMVRQIGKGGGALQGLVPESIRPRIAEFFKNITS